MRAILAMAAAVVLAIPTSAEAAQQSVRRGGKEYVAHTRLAPVLLHRAVPPYWGRHIYQPSR